MFYSIRSGFAIVLKLNYFSERERHKPGESHWLKTASTGGTTADKVAALTLLVQESPVHSLHHLDSLLVKLNKKSRRETFMALGQSL